MQRLGFVGEIPDPVPLSMKAILEFTLPEENHEHQDALRGSEWKFAVDDLLRYLRNQIKHAENSADEYRAFERVRERISEILDDRRLSLYE